MNDDGYWAYAEWATNTVDKIIEVALAAPVEHQADYLRVQLNLALSQALRHGRSGRGDNDPVTP